MQAYVNLRSRGRVCGIPYYAGLIAHDSVAPLQHSQWTELRELGGEPLQMPPVAGETRADDLCGGMLRGLQPPSIGGQTGPHVEVADTQFQNASLALAHFDSGAHAVA